MAEFKDQVEVCKASWAYIYNEHTIMSVILY